MTIKIPDLKGFGERTVTESTKIYDRTGEILLYDIHANVQRTVIPYNEISHYIKNATVAIEDSEFYNHAGIRPLAIARAILVNIFSLGFSQGGSTITQQVVKNSILTTDKTITRKLKEWILAIKLEQVYTKEEILALYLNESPYGGNLYGVEEASRAFFGKSSKDITLAEAAYLAALPQAPTYYSPYGNHRAELEERKNLVLTRMRELGFITNEEFETAQQEKVSFAPQEEKGIKAPHFVFFIKEQLENQYGRNAVEKGGLTVITTLDYGLQTKAQELAKQYALENKEKYNAENAAIVALDPKTGHILAMVGSRDYFDEEIDGNFNVTLARRQPGSAFKPFAYATAFAKGYTPDTMLFDLKTEFNARCDTEGKPRFASINPDECYMPENYDGIYRGPVSMRDALAQSINVPSVKTLYLAGLAETLQTAERMGISTLSDINRYGLTLVLGGGEVSLLDITSAYGVFANGGIRNPYTGLISVRDKKGEALIEWQPRGVSVMNENIAHMISDVLKDNAARTPAFGAHSYLHIPGRDVAVKTGTTNDYRDAWIIGYTPSIAVGAWAGNNDNSPMEKKVAGFIIAPLWNAFMQEVLKAMPAENFREPEYHYTPDMKPVLRGFWQGGVSYFIDKLSGKRATEYTPEETKEERVVRSVHSILYWVNKDDPRGPQPQNPEEDPQFVLWETPVRQYALSRGLTDEDIGVIPTDTDPIHTPEAAPKLLISGIDENKEYAKNDRVTISVSGEGKFSLSRVDMYINNVYAASVKKAPFVFSINPESIGALGAENTIRFVGYDSVMNKGEATILLRIAQ